MKRRMRRFLVLFAVLLLVLSIGSAAAGPPMGEPPGLERAIEVQEKYNAQLLATPLVVGTGVGLTSEGQPSITIFTERVGARVPRVLEGVPVEVEVTGMFVARSDPTARFDRPV
ncbi:MAG: hypothetical protein U9R48_09525, partial [Chloroflexota bacterium]|nr:hypothetical protein [Chloroflexota bacterium]